jgi:hypothetical protein
MSTRSRVKITPTHPPTHSIQFNSIQFIPPSLLSCSCFKQPPEPHEPPTLLNTQYPSSVTATVLAQHSNCRRSQQASLCVTLQQYRAITGTVGTVTLSHCHTLQLWYIGVGKALSGALRITHCNLAWWLVTMRVTQLLFAVFKPYSMYWLRRGSPATQTRTFILHNQCGAPNTPTLPLHSFFVAVLFTPCCPVTIMTLTR